MKVKLKQCEALTSLFVCHLLVSSQWTFSSSLCTFSVLSFIPYICISSLQNVFRSCFYLTFHTFIGGLMLVLARRLPQHLSVCFVDINECVVGTHNCHADSNCSNTKGSFYCTCLTGYSGDGVHCVGKCTDFSFIIIRKQLLGIIY